MVNAHFYTSPSRSFPPPTKENVSGSAVAASPWSLSDCHSSLFDAHWSQELIAMHSTVTASINWCWWCQEEEKPSKSRDPLRSISRWANLNCILLTLLPWTPLSAATQTLITAASYIKGLHISSLIKPPRAQTGSPLNIVWWIPLYFSPLSSSIIC